METSNIQMEILYRIYHKKSIWELESIPGFVKALNGLFAMQLIFRGETKLPSYDPYVNIRLTPKGIQTLHALTR